MLMGGRWAGLITDQPRTIENLVTLSFFSWFGGHLFPDRREENLQQLWKNLGQHKTYRQLVLGHGSRDLISALGLKIFLHSAYVLLDSTPSYIVHMYSWTQHLPA